MAKVYVSSTFADLKECRARIYRSLRRLEHDVVAMEDYVAQDERPLDKCLADAQSCDIYVGVFAWRYGYVPQDARNPESKSITELEFLAARGAGKPCLIFILDEEAPWSPALMDAQNGSADGGGNIRRLREFFGREKLLSSFRNCDELAELVSTAVTRAVGGPTSAPVTVAQRFREVSEQVLLSYTDADEARARAWATALQAYGLRVRLAPKALLSTAEADFVELEREAVQSQSSIVLVSATMLDQLQTQAGTARHVMSLLEARTGCSLALTTAPPDALPQDWAFSTVVLQAGPPADPPAPDLVAGVVAALESRSPGLRERSLVIGLPFVIVSMTGAEAQHIEEHPEVLEESLSKRSVERFNDLKASLQAKGAPWTARYVDSRLQWRPLGGTTPVVQMLGEILGKLNGATAGSTDRRIKLQYYPIDPWVDGDALLRPIYSGVAQSGCVAIVDELSLFHPTLGRAATFLNHPQVSVVTVAPLSPVRGAIEELLEAETRRQLGEAYSRFEMDFDPRCELRVMEERRLRRWLHSSLPEALRQLREPPPNRGRLAGFREEVGAGRQRVANAIFREGSRG